MKKLLTLFTLLLTVCSGAWGASSVTFDYSNQGPIDGFSVSAGKWSSGTPGFLNGASDKALTVTAASGYVLTGVVITYTGTASNRVGGVPTMAEGSSNTNYTYTAPTDDETTGTISLKGAGTAQSSLTLNFTNGARMSQIVVSYTASGAPATKYTVTYYANGATGDAPTDGTEYTSGSSVTVEGKGDLVNTGYTFVGWNTEDDGTGTTYVPGSTFSITSDTELYAQWLTNNTGYDIEAAVQSMESGESTQDFTSLTEKNFLYSLSGNSKLDNSTDGTGVFDGLNMKTQNNWIGFGVEAGKIVKIKFGKIKGDSPSVSINFSSKTSMSVATSDEKEYAPANENRYFQIFAEDGQGTVIQKISIIDVVPVTIGDAGYASFASTSALDFSNTGITAYIATANGTDNVTMTEIAKVPANTGVVLKGTEGTVNVPVLTGDADDTTDNLLKPGAKTVTQTEADNDYIFAFGRKGGKGGQVGFVKAHEGFTITAGKAYLDLSGKGGAKDVEFLSFVFGDEEQGETDGIKAVTTAVENGVRYNLAGQKVGADYKGIVIVNGKKVIIK